jgi:hypothetical protein
MGVIFANNSESTLAAGINGTQTTLAVAVGEGSRFPVTSASNYFYACLVDVSGNREIIKVITRAGDDFTVIVRGQDDTSGLSFVIGDKVQVRLPKVILEAFRDDIVANTAAIVANDVDIANLDAQFAGTTAAVTVPAPSGTKMFFYSDTLPPTWTIDTGPADCLLGIKGGAQAYNAAGGQKLGTWTPTVHNHTGPSHVHTMNTHIHAMPSHLHTGPSHTHTMNTHVHTMNSHTHTGPSHVHGQTTHLHTIAHIHTMGTHKHTMGTHTHTGPSHTHTGPSHTHTMGTHIHTMGTHIHTMPSHTHTVDIWAGNFTGTTLNLSGSMNRFADSAGEQDWKSEAASGSTAVGKRETTTNVDPGDANSTDPGDTSSVDPGDTNASGTAATGASGTAASGATDPGDTQTVDPGDTNASSAANSGSTDAGNTDASGTANTGSTDPGDTNATDPGDTNASGTANTGSTDPGDTEATDPGDTNASGTAVTGTGSAPSTDRPQAAIGTMGTKD